MTTTTQNVTLKALCNGNIKISSEYGRTRKPWTAYDEWQKQAHPYRVTLTYERRRLTVDFFMGSANTSEPDAEGVIDCLLSDAQAGEQSFEDFCADMGYDLDSRKAEQTWKQCRAYAPKVRRFLGHHFETFLYAER